jgi:hypothetical protein
MPIQKVGEVLKSFSTGQAEVDPFSCFLQLLQLIAVSPLLPSPWSGASPATKGANSRHGFHCFNGLRRLFRPASSPSCFDKESVAHPVLSGRPVRRLEPF